MKTHHILSSPPPLSLPDTTQKHISHCTWMIIRQTITKNYSSLGRGSQLSVTTSWRAFGPVPTYFCSPKKIKGEQWFLMITYLISMKCDFMMLTRLKFTENQERPFWLMPQNF